MNAFIRHLKLATRKLSGEKSITRVFTTSGISLVLIALLLIVIVWTVECARARELLDLPKHVGKLAMALVGLATAHWFAGGKPVHKHAKPKQPRHRKMHG